MEEYNNIVELNQKLSNGILKEVQESRYYNRKFHYDNLED